MNSSRITTGFRFSRFAVILTALALLLLTLAAPAAADSNNESKTPNLGACQNLQIEAGHKVAFDLFAKGVQIYRWDGSAWVFVAPQANLFLTPLAFFPIGTHYAGPTWEGLGGSKVVGAVVDRCTPNPAAIPWLKLRAVSTTGPGAFANVTFIQRVDTVGGTAPTTPGTAIGEEARVPYTTTYYFYRADH